MLRDDLRSDRLAGWAVRDAHDDLAGLTDWAVETRCPGDYPEPNDADANRAMSQARALYDSIVAEFRKRGVLAA